MTRRLFAAIAGLVVALSASPSRAGWFGLASAPPASDHLVVDLPRAPYGPRDPMLSWQMRLACGSAWSRVPPYAAFLQRRGRLSPAWRPCWDRTVVLTMYGKSLAVAGTRAGRQYGGGTITFAYSGWTAAQQQQLAAYVNAIYPRIVSIYGAPASSITVTIVRDPDLHDVLGGVYIPALNEIHLLPLNDFSRESFVLACLIVRAFHDDLFMAREVWETGFARAVGLVAHLQVQPSFDLRGEPYYLLPFYDLLNQRPLAGRSVFPASGYAGMTFWRIGMAQAGWLKVYAENPGFFRDFNAAYYAEYDPAATPPLSERIARLRQIAAAAAPDVEGQPFADWFARQFVLDTSGWPGEKLYLLNLPQADNATVYLEAEYYRCTSSGDEQPLAGTGSFQFIGWDGRLHLPEAGDAIPIRQGQGFLSPTFVNIPSPQRMTIELAVGSQIAESWFPFGAVSTAGAHNEYFGVVIDGDSGSVSVAAGSAPAEGAAVVRGVFSIDEPSPLNFLGQTAVELQPSGGAASVRLVNTGFLHYVFVMRAFPLQPGTVRHSFAAGTAMVSLPLSPDASDAAAVLGLARGQTLLARWSATLPGQYAFYPSAPPIEPGLGYWLTLGAPITATAHGLQPNGQYQAHVRRGWQQIANPFPAAAVSASAVRVKVGVSAPVTLAQAQAAGMLSALYRYSGGAYVVAQALQPYEGLWIYVQPAEGCWFIVQEP